MLVRLSMLHFLGFLFSFPFLSFFSSSRYSKGENCWRRFAFRTVRKFVREEKANYAQRENANMKNTRSNLDNSKTFRRYEIKLHSTRIVYEIVIWLNCQLSRDFTRFCDLLVSNFLLAICVFRDLQF